MHDWGSVLGMREYDTDDSLPARQEFARKMVCRDCNEFRRSVRWPYPRCQAMGLDSNGNAVQELDDEFMQGPKMNCPKALWDRPRPPAEEHSAVGRVTNTEQLEKMVEECREAARVLWNIAPVIDKVSAELQDNTHGPLSRADRLALAEWASISVDPFVEKASQSLMAFVFLAEYALELAANAGPGFAETMRKEHCRATAEDAAD